MLMNIYIYIYEKIESTESEFNTPRKMLDYIKFDVLNDIFYMNNRTVIELIKYIYEGLEGVMNVNPQFKHQRAKSILWLCRDNFDDVKDAANYVDLARYDVQNLLKRKYNEKLKISLEHIKYTQASIYGRMCAISNYKDANMVQKSLFYYKEALMSTENSNEREEIIKKKAQKYIYEDFQNLLKHISTHKDAYSNLLDDVEFLVNELRISL